MSKDLTTEKYEQIKKYYWARRVKSPRYPGQNFIDGEVIFSMTRPAVDIYFFGSERETHYHNDLTYEEMNECNKQAWYVLRSEDVKKG